MSIKGGYKIIDLKNISLSTTEVIIKGVYDSIENSYGKPLLLSGINIGGVEKNDVYVTPILDGTDYKFICYGGTIAITDDDEITFTEDE